MVFVCVFVSKKRQNGWTDQAQILCGNSRDPREGFMNYQNIWNLAFFVKFWKYYETR